MIFKIKKGITDVQSLFPEIKLSKDDINWIFGSRGCGKTPPEFHGQAYDLKDENKTPTWGDDDPEYQEEKK